MAHSSPDKVLGRLDPYEVACAMEAYVRELDRKTIVRYLLKAGDRLPSYYRGTIVAHLVSDGTKPNELDAATFKRIVAGSRDQEALRDALIDCLRGNLRAIPMIGDSFAENVLRLVRGEDARRRGTSQIVAILTGSLVAAVALGAAGEQVAEKTPIGPLTSKFFGSPSPAPRAMIQPQAETRHVASKPERASRHVLAIATAPPTTAPTMAPTIAPTAAPTTAPTPGAAAAPETPAPSPAPSPRPTQLAAGTGAATVNVPTPTPNPTESPDLTDMPDATQDGQPLPSARPAEAPEQVNIVQPTPTPTSTPVSKRHHHSAARAVPTAMPSSRP